eukprot:3314789-Pyramimonas_sp.AAC.1
MPPYRGNSSGRGWPSGWDSGSKQRKRPKAVTLVPPLDGPRSPMGHLSPTPMHVQPPKHSATVVPAMYYGTLILLSTAKLHGWKTNGKVL